MEIARRDWRYRDVLFQYIGIAGKKVPGIIQIGLTPEELSIASRNYDIQIAIKKFKVDNYGGFPFILTRDGVFLNHPNITYIGKNVSTLVWGDNLLNSPDGNGSFIFSDDSVIVFEDENYKLVVFLM